MPGHHLAHVLRLENHYVQALPHCELLCDMSKSKSSDQCPEMVGTGHHQAIDQGPQASSKMVALGCWRSPRGQDS